MTDRWPLIRRLATEVMGWPVLTTHEEVGIAASEGGGFVAEVEAPGFFGEVSPFYAVRPIPSPSARWNPFESVDDAWLLVEKLREQGVVMVEVHNDGWTEARLIIPGEDGSRASGSGPSAAEAICRAALKTLPEETP